MAKLSNSSVLRDDFKIKNILNYIVIAAVVAVCYILHTTGGLKTSTSLLLSEIGYSVILAVSLNLVVGFLGELSLGHAGFMCIGAYLGTFVSVQLMPLIGSKIISLLIGMLAGGICAAVFGLLVGLPALRLKGDYLAIVTLAFGEIVRNIFKNLEIFGGASGYETDAVKFTKRDFPMFVIILLTLIVVLFFIQNLIRSKHGRAITAIRDNEIAAKAMGINVTYYKLLVFVIAAFFAGIAGVFYGHLNTPIRQENFTYNYSIEILVMVVLGGMASVNGSIVAATLITVINTLLQDKLSGDLAALRFLVYALILIVAVIYNNAPKLAPIKERFSVEALMAKITAKKRKPEDILNDPAHWDKIPTKIDMNEVLSTDITPGNEYTPDKPGKGGK